MTAAPPDDGGGIAENHMHSAPNPGGETVCATCDGSGQADGRECPACGGTGKVEEPAGGA